jgi:hypothetical protein
LQIGVEEKIPNAKENTGRQDPADPVAKRLPRRRGEHEAAAVEREPVGGGRGDLKRSPHPDPVPFI